MRQLKGNSNEDAYHSLIECGPAILPELRNAYSADPDPHFRTQIVDIAAQFRVAEALPLLADALAAPAPEVWKAAVDGLVGLGSEEAIAALQQAVASTGSPSPEFTEWVNEAIEQMRERLE